MKGYQVHVLGTFQCKYNGRPLSKLPTGKLQALFAYFMLHQDLPINRKHLAFQFWPESKEIQALTNLRKLLHYLKRLLPAVDDYLVVKDGQILWKSDAVCCVDAAQFRKLTEGGMRELEEALSLYHGELLPGVYDDWVVPLREELSMKYVSALRRLGDIHEQRRAYDQAIHYAHKILLLEPLSEEAHLVIIRRHFLNGNHGAAVKQYQQLEEMLAEHLGVTPSARTTEVYKQLHALDKAYSPSPEKQKTSLAGRKQEWEIMLRAWKQVQEQQSMFVLVKGEAGIGKTRLAEQFSQWASVQGISVFIAQCYSSAGSSPYEPVAAWLEGASLSGLDPMEMSEISRLLPYLHKRFPDLSKPEPIREAWQLRSWYQAIERALLCNPHPVILVIDDLQWSDDETLHLLEYLLRPEQKLPMLVIGTLRTSDEEFAAHVREFIGSLHSRRKIVQIELGPLTQAEAEELIHSYRENSSLDLQKIYAVSGGNPLYITEIFMQTGTGADGSKEELDTTLQALMVRRLSALPSAYRKGIEYLSVLGKPAALSFFMLLSPQHDQMTEQLDHLQQLRILKQTERGLFDFYHDQMREAVLHSMSMTTKTLLHLKIAEWMQQTESSGLYSPAEIAFHFDRSGNEMMAAPYFEQAAIKTSQLYEHEMTIQYCTRLMRILPPEKRTRPMSLLAEAYRMNGRWQQAEECYRTLLNECSQSMALGEKGMHEVRLSICLQLQGKYQEALALLRASLHTFEFIDDTEGLTEAYRNMSTIYLYSGQFDQAIECLEMSIAKGGGTGNDGKLLGVKAELYYEQTLYAEALLYFKQQIKLANAGGHRLSLTKAFSGVALTCMETEQYVLAFESIDECFRLSRSLRDRMGIALSLGIMGKIYMRAGWEHMAMPCFLYCLHEAIVIGDRRSTAILLGLTGHTLQALGEDEYALLLLKQSESISKKMYSPLFYGNSLYYQGNYYLRRKQWEQAEYYLSQAQHVIMKYNRKDLACSICLMLLECSLATGAISRHEAGRKVRDLLQQYTALKDQVMIHRALWKLNESEDDRSKALALLHAAYRDISVPIYQHYAETLHETLPGEPMLAPPLPEEAAASTVSLADLAPMIEELA